VTTTAATQHAMERAQLTARWVAANHRSIDAPSGAHQVSYPPADLRILAQRELAIPGRYHLGSSGHAAGRGTPWWLVAYQWFYDRWTELWRLLFERVHVGRGGAVAIGDVIVALVALLLIFIGVRLLLQVQRERRRRAQSMQALATPPSPAELHRQASEFARRGDYADACRLLFAATLAKLEVQAVVHEERSATIGEIRRALRSRAPALLVPFDAIAIAFATVAYAERPVGLGDWERAQEAYRVIGGATY
jgi:hypothetical protein